MQVAREMGIEAHGLDLHSGFNILKQSILEVVGKPSDFGAVASALSQHRGVQRKCMGQGTQMIYRVVQPRMNLSRN